MFPDNSSLRRSIVLDVNYLQKINLKRVGADLLLTIYRTEKSFVTRLCTRNEKRPRLARASARARAVTACGQFLRKYNKLHAVIRSKARLHVRLRGSVPRKSGAARGINNSCHLTNPNAVANSSHRDARPKQQRARFHGGTWGSAYTISRVFVFYRSPAPPAPHRVRLGVHWLFPPRATCINPAMCIPRIRRAIETFQ